MRFCWLSLSQSPGVGAEGLWSMNGTIVTPLEATQLGLCIMSIRSLVCMCVCVCGGCWARGDLLGMFGPGSAHCLKAIPWGRWALRASQRTPKLGMEAPARCGEQPPRLGSKTWCSLSDNQFAQISKPPHNPWLVEKHLSLSFLKYCNLLTAPGLSCSTQDLPSSLQHVNS